MHLGDVISAQQDQLETVIPAIGKDVMVVNGAYNGQAANLLEVLHEKFALKVRIKHGVHNGRVIEVTYEDASKFKDVSPTQS